MSAPKRMRRDALLLDPDVIMAADYRGHRWFTDRFVMVREDLFKRPPTKLNANYTPDGLLRPGAAARILRGCPYDDTLPLTVVGDLPLVTPSGKPLAVYAARNSLVIAMQQSIADGLTEAGLYPRLAIGKSQTVVRWYRARNATQRTLYAVTAPVAAKHGLRVAS